MLSTDQVTAVFVLFCTVAANCVLVPTARATAGWFSETLTCGGAGVDEGLPPQLTENATAKLRLTVNILDLLANIIRLSWRSRTSSYRWH
jgi:hypothetical protein